MKNLIIAFLFILSSMSFIGTSNAQSNETATSIIIAIDDKDVDGNASQRCDDNPEAMSACRSFIKGFIQGALLTDAAIIKTIEQSEPSFTERAFKTRLNNSPTELAGFCLPEGLSILQIVEETLDHVKDSRRISYELARKVYRSLKADYAC